MDFETAQQVILRQALAIGEDGEDMFISRLNQGKPPIPGQVTSLLLALKVLYEGLKQEPALSREMVHALFNLSYESRQYFHAGQRAGVNWPPMLDDDLRRIASGVKAIITNSWNESSP